MRVGALLRRASPYLVIAVSGFALAYGVVFFFVLPPTGAAPRDALARDSSAAERAETGTPADPLPNSMMASTPETALVAPPPQAPPVSLPDLSGMSMSDARTVLNALQLGIVIERDTSSFEPENTVLQQMPPVGTIVERGSNVTIVLSHFPLPADSSAHRGAVSKP